MALTTDSQRPPRRTQQERRDGTQRLLLEATVQCLIDLGYKATTTLEVELRAGVSRGARIHHFATKASLLAAAVDHLYRQLSDHYEQAFSETPQARSESERFHDGLRLLWSIYKRPDYAAVLELNIAARTDDELREHLRAVSAHHRELAIAAADRYFRLDPSRARLLVEAIHTSLIGLLLQRNVQELGDCEMTEQFVLASLDELVSKHLIENRKQWDPPADKAKEQA
jgi:AcrR family transcriptional regulator